MWKLGRTVTANDDAILSVYIADFGKSIWLGKQSVNLVRKTIGFALKYRACQQTVQTPRSAEVAFCALSGQTMTNSLTSLLEQLACFMPFMHASASTLASLILLSWTHVSSRSLQSNAHLLRGSIRLLPSGLRPGQALLCCSFGQLQGLHLAVHFSQLCRRSRCIGLSRMLCLLQACLHLPERLPANGGSLIPGSNRLLQIVIQALVVSSRTLLQGITIAERGAGSGFMIQCILEAARVN